MKELAHRDAKESGRTTPVVLFVDDEPEILNAVRNTLRREPYEIVTARSPAEALDILKDRRVDVIVSDQHMAKMSGEELLEIVRLQSPATVRIMLTGGADLVTNARVIEGGLYRFLCKPFAAPELANTIRSAIERKRVAEQCDRIRRGSP